MSFALEPTVQRPVCTQVFIGLGVMLFSLVTMAENTGEPGVSTAHDQRVVDEIYSSAGDWRNPVVDESDWRPEAEEQKSRINFGYDSAYEEMLTREGSKDMYTGPDLEEVRPNTQFRTKFNF